MSLLRATRFPSGPTQARDATPKAGRGPGERKHAVGVPASFSLLPCSITWLLCVLAISSCSREPAEIRGDLGDRGTRVATSDTPRPRVDVPADAPLVVFLGDSISAGLHLPADQAFPAVLQRELTAQGNPFRLVNAGVSGDTTAGGLARVDWILKQRPDVVVVELGGNDGLRGQDLANVEANLRAIVTRVGAAGARVLLLGVRIPPSYGATYADGFAAIYPRVASEMGVPLVPYFMEGVGGVPEMVLEDGLHPTARGHEKLAANVAAALRTELAAVASARR